MAEGLEEGLLQKQKKEKAEEEETWSLDDLRASLADLAAHRRSSASEQRRRRWRLQPRQKQKQKLPPAADGAIAGYGSSELQDQRPEWRRKLGELLESTVAHSIVLALLLLDLFATIVDILHTLREESAQLSECVAKLDSCTCAAISSSISAESGSFDPWELLSYLGISILVVLLLNALGLLLSLGPRTFFSHPGYVLDLAVVFTALSLELALDSGSSIGLLLILNLWRIVRVAHGIFEFTDEAWEQKVEQLREQIDSVELLRRTDLDAIRDLRRRIRILEEEEGKEGENRHEIDVKST